MEDIDGGLHPAVDGQSLDEMRFLTVDRGRKANFFPSFRVCLSKAQWTVLVFHIKHTLLVWCELV